MVGYISFVRVGNRGKRRVLGWLWSRDFGWEKLSQPACDAFTYDWIAEVWSECKEHAYLLQRVYRKAD